jgi:hypothetical protein
LPQNAQRSDGPPLFRYCEQCDEVTQHHTGRKGQFFGRGQTFIADFMDDGPRCVPCTIEELSTLRDLLDQMSAAEAAANGCASVVCDNADCKNFAIRGRLLRADLKEQNNRAKCPCCGRTLRIIPGPPPQVPRLS